MKLWQIEELALGEKAEKNNVKNFQSYSVESLRKISETLSIKETAKKEIIAAIENKFKNKRSINSFLKSLDQNDLIILKLASEQQDDNKNSILYLVRQSHLKGVDNSFLKTFSLIEKGLLIVRWYKNSSEVFKIEDCKKASYVLEVFVNSYVEKAVSDVQIEDIFFDPAFPARTLSGTHLDPSMLLHEYYVVMRHIYHQPVELIKSGRAKSVYVKKSLKRINQLISSIDEDQFEYMLMLLETGGLIERNRKTNRLMISEKGLQWFELSPLQKLKQLFLATSNNNFDFLALDYYAKVHSDTFINHASSITVDNAKINVKDDWCYLPEILSIVPQDNFVKLSEIINFAGNGYPYLFFNSYDELQSIDINTKITDEQKRIQKIIFTGYIEEIATPMGLVEWAIGKKSGELLIRLTKLGAFFLGLKNEDDLDYNALNQQGPAIVVQPDFDVLVFLDKVSLKDSLALLNICSTTNEQSAQSPVRRLQLNKNSVKWAIEDKMEQNEILNLLKKLSFDTIPQNVKVELNEWTGGSYPVELYRGYDLFEFNTEAERDSFLSKNGEAIAVSKRFLLVESTLKKTSKNLIDYTKTAPKELKIAQEGSIIRNMSGPKSLETQKILDTLAERTSENSWLLSNKMLAKSDYSSRKVVDFLEKTSESLPPSVYTTIKGTLDKNTEIKSAKMEIVEIGDKRLLKGLMEHEATKEFIAGNIGPNHLAIHNESSKAFWKAAKTLGLMKSKAQLEKLPKTTGRLSNDKKAGDLSGFCMVKGSEKKQKLVNAINNGWDVELLILESSLSYYYSRSKLDIVSGTPLGFEGNTENYLRLKTGVNNHVSIIKLQAIKAIRDLL